MSLYRTAAAGGGTVVSWPVVILYLVVEGFLGVGLLYTISQGKDYSVFLTSMTTIAGFAVGANVNK